MKVVGLDRVVIMVKNMDKALSFFSGKLGMKFLELDQDISKRDGVLSYVCHKTHIHLISPIIPLPANAAPPMKKRVALLNEHEALINAVTFMVDDVQGARSELEEEGYRIQHIYPKSNDYDSIGLGNFEEIVINENDALGIVLGLANYRKEGPKEDPSTASTIKLSGIDRIVIMVKDMDRALSIFSGKLGLRFRELDPEVQKKAGNRGCVCHDAHIHLVQPNDPLPDDAPPPMKKAAELLKSKEAMIMLLIFKTEDAKTASRTMAKEGFKVARSWENDRDYVSVGMDELYEYLFDPTQTLGIPILISNWKRASMS